MPHQSNGATDSGRASKTIVADAAYASSSYRSAQGNDAFRVHALKATLDFRDLVSKTHDVNKDGKTTCPVHDDHTPSLHVYDDHAFCFSCGWHADAITWLGHIHSYTMAEALAELEHHASGYAPTAYLRHTAKSTPRTATPKLVSLDVLERHLSFALQLTQVPPALAGRGFTLDDLQTLGVAASGDDAVFPITGPTSDVVALKRRYAVPRGKTCYSYDTRGHGTPAWCSLGFRKAAEVFICEGELNGMAAWLARPQLGVMGVAGTNGKLHTQALEGKTVYVYADGDEAGQKARDRWAQQALKAGAKHVYVLDAWEMDACDVAGKLGREELARRLA